MIRTTTTLFGTAGLLIASTLIASCASREAHRAAAPAEPASEARTDSDEARTMLEGEAPQSGVESLVKTNNLFAFDLYRATRRDHFVISPHGLAGSLAIVHAGAAGTSAKQVAKTLRFDVEEADLQAQFVRLHDVLRSRATPASRDVHRGFSLLVSPAVWTSASVEPSASFRRVATQQHFGHIAALDFADGASGAAKTINAHYRDVTTGKADALVKGVNAEADIYVTHTVQFDAPWALPFERGLTEQAQFQAPDGARTVPMMHGRIRTSYLEGEQFQLVELPYADGRVAAWVILPAPAHGGFDATITADYFAWMVASARQRDVDVRLPRFELASTHSLGAVLRTMGMPDLFDRETADLRGLTETVPDSPLALEDVVQFARLKVDEDGSDALAATRGSVTGAGGELPKFEASRPFVVVVRDNPTGAIITIARVSSP